jgi:hypothetical protein
LVALLALAFSFGPLGHADRYLPASQSTPTLPVGRGVALTSSSQRLHQNALLRP